MNLEINRNRRNSSTPERGDFPDELSSPNATASSQEDFVNCPHGQIESEFFPLFTAAETDETGGGSCSACPLKDCPTRGIMEKKFGEISAAEQANSLTPVQMVLASGFVFIFPLLCAVVGIYGMNAIQIANFSDEVRAVLGATIGFFSGLLLVQSVLRFKRFWNGH